MKIRVRPVLVGMREIFDLSLIYHCETLYNKNLEVSAAERIHDIKKCFIEMQNKNNEYFQYMIPVSFQKISCASI